VKAEPKTTRIGGLAKILGRHRILDLELEREFSLANRSSGKFLTERKWTET
jgi:hypothetical protein